MKYDIIIIGGGLSGLTAGISLAEKGKKVAIVSLGQSALHFSSGSFGLLGQLGDKEVASPLEAMKELDESHPYRRIGLDRVADLAREVKPLFAAAGMSLKGDEKANRSRLTPFGSCKPSWLTFSDFITFENGEKPAIKKCVIVNFKGYLDFYPDYIADGLARMGIESTQATVSVDVVERLRKSASEMRAASIARQLRADVIDALAAEINRVADDADADTVLMPAVVGFDSEKPLEKLREKVLKPLYCVATTPMSVCGTRAQLLLRRRFEQLGGTYLLGDNVVSGRFAADGSLKSVMTTNLGDDEMEASTFILATGGLFSRGVVADPHKFYEPVFGLDVKAPEDREQWYERDFFARQPYMTFGVSVDAGFHPLRAGKPVANLYAVGSVIGGYDALKEVSGAGVALLTALHVANLIK